MKDIDEIAAEAADRLRDEEGAHFYRAAGIAIIKSAIEKAYEQGKDDMRWINQQLAEGSTPAAAMRKDK